MFVQNSIKFFLLCTLVFGSHEKKHTGIYSTERARTRRSGDPFNLQRIIEAAHLFNDQAKCSFLKHLLTEILETKVFGCNLITDDNLNILCSKESKPSFPSTVLHSVAISHPPTNPSQNSVLMLKSPSHFTPFLRPTQHLDLRPLSNQSRLHPTPYPFINSRPNKQQRPFPNLTSTVISSPSKPLSLFPDLKTNPLPNLPLKSRPNRFKNPFLNLTCNPHTNQSINLKPNSFLNQFLGSIHNLLPIPFLNAKPGRLPKPNPFSSLLVSRPGSVHFPSPMRHEPPYHPPWNLDPTPISGTIPFAVSHWSPKPVPVSRPPSSPPTAPTTIITSGPHLPDPKIGNIVIEGTLKGEAGILLPYKLEIEITLRNPDDYKIRGKRVITPKDVRIQGILNIPDAHWVSPKFELNSAFPGFDFIVDQKKLKAKLISIIKTNVGGIGSFTVHVPRPEVFSKNFMSIIQEFLIQVTAVHPDPEMMLHVDVDMNPSKSGLVKHELFSIHPEVILNSMTHTFVVTIPEIADYLPMIQQRLRDGSVKLNIPGIRTEIILKSLKRNGRGGITFTLPYDSSLSVQEIQDALQDTFGFIIQSVLTQKEVNVQDLGYAIYPVNEFEHQDIMNTYQTVMAMPYNQPHPRFYFNPGL